MHIYLKRRFCISLSYTIFIKTYPLSFSFL
nr:MAG TPA: hypothetical protein [Siphoviridae sp. ct6662]